MISHTFKFIFIHIPKTSGNSLSLFLRDIINNKVILRNSNLGPKQGISIICEKINKDIKHEPITYYYNLYGDNIKNYFKFTIVRNPYDRMLSFYYWSRGENKQIFKKNQFIEFIQNNDSFQHEYIDDSFHIVYFEDLINNLKKIDIFKDDVDFDKYPVLNASLNRELDWEIIYDKELKDLVYDKFKKDFELFGYKY